MRRLNNFALAMAKIGLVGFGGGSALIPIIEDSVVKEKELISKDEYDIDVMVASITPGALPVEVAGGVGRRIGGSLGMVTGAVAMALPGVVLTIGIMSILTVVNPNVLTQIGFLSIGVFAFISSLLCNYITSTVKNFSGAKHYNGCIAIIVLVSLLVSGRNICELLSVGNSFYIKLSTVQIFAMAFAVIFFAGSKYNQWKMVFSAVICILYVLSNCKVGIMATFQLKTTMEIALAFMGIYGIVVDVKKGSRVNGEFSIKGVLKELATCVLFAIIIIIPANMFISSTMRFFENGVLSSVMSFGGGDAYLTVADGIFVDGNMISKEQFYSVLVPLVNVLPGSILCKTLAGIGYFVGYNSSNSVWIGLIGSTVGFAASIAASCGVFSIVSAFYELFGTLNIFSQLKIWIRTIISGLLINVMLSMLAQVKKQSVSNADFGVRLTVFFVVFILNEILTRKTQLSKSAIVIISILTSLLMLNTATCFY